MFYRLKCRTYPDPLHGDAANQSFEGIFEITFPSEIIARQGQFFYFSFLFIFCYTLNTFGFGVKMRR